MSKEDEEAEKQRQADIDEGVHWDMEQAEKERIYNLAKLMHDEYEVMARQVGWKTQESCRVEFDSLPEANRKVMLHVAEKTLEQLDKEDTKHYLEIDTLKGLILLKLLNNYNGVFPKESMADRLVNELVKGIERNLPLRLVNGKVIRTDTTEKEEIMTEVKVADISQQRFAVYKDGKGGWCGSLTDMAWALEFGYRAHEKGDRLIKAIEDMNAVLKK